MTLDEALNEMTELIKGVAPDAVLKTTKRSADEMTIRAYVPAATEDAVREATQARSVELLVSNQLDVQVLIYDIETSLAPEDR